MPKFIIARYQEGIDISKRRSDGYWHLDMEAFWDNLEEVLKDKGISYKVINAKFGHTFTEKNSISLCYHSKGDYSNIWHIKKGYVPGYLYFDKAGYSGWSEQRFDPKKVLTKEEIENTKKLMRFFIDNNLSKIEQPDDAVIPENPYVLVLGQQPRDSVMSLAYINTIKLPQMVSDAYRNTNIQVFAKPHPCYREGYPGRLITGSLHKLINSARAVYTVNSGSGFEALLHGKTVFTSGKSDYSPAAITVETMEDIMNTRFKIKSRNTIIKYLHYAFNEHFVNVYSKESIGRKVDRAIEEFIQ